MKNDNAVTWRISQLSSRLDPSLVTGLWILRSASPDYQPAYEQLGILDMLRESIPGEPQATTPWDTVVNAADGNRVSAVAQALRAVMPQSPLPALLEAIPPLTHSGERCLNELISILCGVSPDAVSLSRLYPDSAGSDSALSRYSGVSLPSGILRLLLSCLELNHGNRIYDPCGGSLLTQAADLLPQAKTFSLFAQASNSAAYQLAHVRAYLHGIRLELGSKAADTLTEDLHFAQKFDCILANPPFNQPNWYADAETEYDPRWQYGLPPRSNGNFAWLQHVVSHLEEHGRGVVILPNGTLTTRTQAERDIRAGLLRAGVVEAIIALPSGIFSGTKIPCCVWLLTGSALAHPTTLFIDAQDLNLTDSGSEDLLKLTGVVYQHRQGLLLEKTAWYAAATLEDIARKDFVLSPNFYTRPATLSPASLQGSLSQLHVLIDSLEPQLQNSGLYSYLAQWKHTSPAKRWHKAPVSELYQISGGIVKNKAAFGHGTPMADVVTVIRNFFLPHTLSAQVETTPAEFQKYRIQAGDIFLNRSSENLEELACCCVAPTDQDAVFGGYLKRLRPLSGIHPRPEYIAAYFRSAIYRQEIRNVSPVFTTRSNINTERLSKVNVYYPDEAMQEQLGQTILAVFRFQESCFDQALTAQLEQFTQLLIAQFITYPILLTQEENS